MLTLPSTAEAISPATPAEVARRILGCLFPWDASLDRDQTSDNPIGLEDFQLRAVRGAQALIARRGGCLLCDSVGLGKTFVALELARATLKRGESVVVVVTTAIRAQWAALLRRHLRKYYEPTTRRVLPRITLLTHTQLSRGSYRQDLVGRSGLLVIDEAHAFRNSATRRYGAARTLAGSRSVFLLTATPVNNSLLDLYRLIRLWAEEDAYADMGIAHLKSFFQDTLTHASASAAFQALLRESMIRRSRDEVRAELESDCNRTSSGLRFPRLAAPVAIHFNADNGATGSHASILEGIAGLQLSVFGEGNAALLRFLLLKRLESSCAALFSTIRRMHRFHCEFIAAADENLFLQPIDMRAAGADADIQQLSMRRLTLRAARPQDRLSDLRRSALDDCRNFDLIVKALSSADPASDDKLHHLRRLVQLSLRGQKALVFTEYRETAAYLLRVLVPMGGVAMVNGAGAWLGRGFASRRAVLERFASSRFPSHERVRVLIATDVLSEGLNLQDCAHVVSYDLPWNPVRLMQRIGRIDRLGSPHDVVHAYNFLPGHRLEADLQILRRLRIKLHAIGMALGAERPVLAQATLIGDDSAFEATAQDEELEARLRQWMRQMSREEMRAPNPAATHDSGSVLTVAIGLPASTAQTRSTDPASEIASGVLLVALHNEGVVTAASYADGILNDVDPVAVSALCVDYGDKSFVGWTADDERDVMRAIDAFITSYAGSTWSSGCGNRRVDSQAAQALLARRLIESLAASPCGPTPEDAARVEHAIARLASGTSANPGPPRSSLESSDPSLVELLDLADQHSSPSRRRLDPSSEPKIVAAVVVSRG